MQELLKKDLEPTLYIVVESYILFLNKTLLATFADDTAILATEKHTTFVVDALQPHLNKINTWAKKLKIEINKDKSVQVNCSLRQNKCTQLQINNKPISIQLSTKYLGIILDKRLT